MYTSNQTLRHKVSNKIVAIHPDVNIWNLNSNVKFIDENGSIFNDNINNYTYIEDWFGRPAFIRGKSKNEFVDIELKQFIVDDKTKAIKKKEATDIWLKLIFNKLDKSISDETFIVNCPFADGSKCKFIEDEFYKKVNAKPLYFTHNLFKNNDEYIPSSLFFNYGGYIWKYSDTSHLVVVKMDDSEIDTFKPNIINKLDKIKKLAKEYNLPVFNGESYNDDYNIISNKKHNIVIYDFKRKMLYNTISGVSIIQTLSCSTLKNNNFAIIDDMLCIKSNINVNLLGDDNITIESSYCELILKDIIIIPSNIGNDEIFNLCDDIDSLF